MPAITQATRQEVINSLSTLELVTILNNFDVRSVAQKDKVTGLPNGKVSTNFAGTDGKRHWLNRVQDASKLDSEGRAQYSWVLGDEMKPKVEVTA